MADKPKRANRKSTKDDFIESLIDARKDYDPATFRAIETYSLDLAKRIGHLNLKPEDYAPVPAVQPETGTVTED